MQPVSTPIRLKEKYGFKADSYGCSDNSRAELEECIGYLKQLMEINEENRRNALVKVGLKPPIPKKKIGVVVQMPPGKITVRFRGEKDG